MRRLAGMLIVLSLLAFAGTALAGNHIPIPQFPREPKGWTHLNVNVTTKRVSYTMTLDRGRITQVNETRLTLREQDGSFVVVPLSPSTIVVIGNLRGTVLDLQKRMTAQTMRINGGAAVRVRASF